MFLKSWRKLQRQFESARNCHAISREHVQDFRKVGRAGGNLIVDCGEHLGGTRTLAGNFEHLAAAFAVTKAMHTATRGKDKSAHGAHLGFVLLQKFNFATQYIKRFVPVVAVRWWTGA